MSANEYPPHGDYNPEPRQIKIHELLPNRESVLTKPSADIETVRMMTGIHHHILLATIEFDAKFHQETEKNGVPRSSYSDRLEFYIFQSTEYSPDLVHSGLREATATDKEQPEKFLAGLISVIDGESLIQLAKMNFEARDAWPHQFPDEEPVAPDIHVVTLPNTGENRELEIGYDTPDLPWNFGGPEFSTMRAAEIRFQLKFDQNSFHQTPHGLLQEYNGVTTIINKSAGGNYIRIFESL